MKYLPIFNWMIRWSLLATLLAGAAGIYLWKNSDSLVQTQVLKKFSELAPDLLLEVGRTEVQGTESVIFHDVQLFEAATRKALLRAKQIRLDIDSDQLINHQRLVLDQVVLNAADILMERQQDGRWNWQNYRFNLPKVRGTLPAILIQDARVQLTLDHGAGFPAARLLLACPNAQAIPESADSYDFEGALDLPGAGTLRVSGAADFAVKTWHIGGSLKNVSADQRLMDLASTADPSLQDKLSGIDTMLASKLPPRTRQHNDFRTAGVPGAALQFGNDRRIAPQFLGTLDVDFEAASKADSAIPDFKLLIDIRDGRIASGVIPIGLDHVTARFYKDNDNLEFRLTQANIGTGKLSGNLLLPAGNQSEATANFLVERLPVNGQLRPMLPEKSRRIFDAYEPEGSVSVRGQVVRAADGKWRPKDVLIQVHDTQISYEKFQYPAVISGVLVQRPDVADFGSTAPPSEPFSLDINLVGSLGRHPFDLKGWLKNPGDRGELRLQLDVADFPLDGDFRNALLKPQQRVVETLGLTGIATGSFTFIRPPGLNQPTHPSAQIAIKRGSVQLEKFPYLINELSGRVTYRGATKQWNFEDLKGEHKNAIITAEGSFHGSPAPGVLQMTLKAQHAALDADMYNALTAPQRKIWSMLNPDGFCDFTTDIHWTALPGQPAVVKFPAESPVRIYNTKMKAAPFPYSLTIEEALVSFDPNSASKAGVQHCEIHSFRAMHDDTPVQAKGWFEVKPNQEWQLHLWNLYASKLKPDRDLRAALPASWEESLSRLYNHGTISIHDSELDFRGDVNGEKNPTASWDMTMNLDDCTVMAGLDVSEIHGRLTAQGVWDGFHLQNNGWIRLDTAAVLEMPFTNIEGPYSVNDVELVLGARRLFESNQSRASVPKEQRINANAYGGSMLVDAVLDLRDEGQYKFFSEVENAKLESYAALHIPDQPNLRGVVTAWMSLSGFGDDLSDVSGKGQLRISPAALYELPVMVKVLSAWSRLNPNVQNLTAFTYAFVNFNVVDQFFEMNKIDLVGEEISFRGQGSVGFKGAVELDFYSQPPPRRGLSFPIINELFTRWTKVEVRGTTSRPQPNAKVLGQLDENLRQFLQPFSQRSAGAVPVLQVPSLLPFQPLRPLNRQNIDRSLLPQLPQSTSPLARPRSQSRF